MSPQGQPWGLDARTTYSTIGEPVSEARYPSKERVERDGVLVYAEGDDIPQSDPDELKRQGYNPDSDEGASVVTAPERIEQDGVLLYAEGDEIPGDVAEKLGITTTKTAAPAKKAAAKKSK